MKRYDGKVKLIQINKDKIKKRGHKTFSKKLKVNRWLMVGMKITNFEMNRFQTTLISKPKS